jgi:hypothetical protein
VLTLDPSGRAQDTRFVVAAEWVGIHRSRTADEHEVRFVAAGVAHALDSASDAVLCGADRGELALFAVDFLTDRWGLHCPDCERRLGRQS